MPDPTLPDFSDLDTSPLEAIASSTDHRLVPTLSQFERLLFTLSFISAVILLFEAAGIAWLTVLQNRLLSDNSHRESLTECTKNDSVISHLWHDFKTAFSNPIVIKWASWLVFAKGCHFLVLTYNQILWQTVAKEQKTVPLMNGAVEAISTITSAGAAYIVARMSSDWRKGHSLFLFLSCICCSALLFYCGLSTNLWTVYIAYIAYSFIFQSTLTVTESQIAQNIQRDSYALVFGFLNFLAFSLTSLFTVFVIQHSFLREKPTAHQQFEIYGVILFVLAGVVAFESVVTSCRQRSSGTRDAHTTA